jgi:hypothetical protein
VRCSLPGRTALALASVLFLCSIHGVARAEENEAQDDRGWTLSFHGGLGVPGQSGSPYGAGLGLAVAVGYRLPGISLEWRFLESYNLSLAGGEIESFVASGKLGLQSGNVRVPFSLGGRWFAEGIAGVVLATMPVLVSGLGPSRTELGASDISGVGANTGGALMYLAGNFLLSVEARAYAIVWQDPGEPYAKNVVVVNNALTGDASTAGISALPITISFGLTTMF